jgi:hypothetical protein
MRSWRCCLRDLPAECLLRRRIATTNSTASLLSHKQQSIWQRHKQHADRSLDGACDLAAVVHLFGGLLDGVLQMFGGAEITTSG